MKILGFPVVINPNLKPGPPAPKLGTFDEYIRPADWYLKKETK